MRAVKPVKFARVERKSDGASATVVAVNTAVTSVAHPGVYGKTIVTCRLDDAVLRAGVGGDQTGDLKWFRSYWKAAK